jgi:hypothetical protein
LGITNFPSFALVVVSIEEKLNSDAGELARLKAANTFANSAAYSSFFTSAYDLVQSDVSFLWGSAGEALIEIAELTTDGCLFTTCFSQYFSEKSSFITASPSDLYFYTAKSPCCGGCTIFAKAVQVSYWPTPAPTPPVTELVDNSGHT